MYSNSVRILTAKEVLSLISDREADLMDIVGAAYEIHALGESSLPHSSFLRFPGQPQNRIIALPAYLGNRFNVAGIKWISSFPDNVSQNLDRASAVVILNNLLTGRVEAILEGSMISAKRTAASAALAAKLLCSREQIGSAGLVGCGPINFEIARFLRATFPDLRRFKVFDLDPSRAAEFKVRGQEVFGHIDVEVASDLNEVFGSATLVSMATTAGTPHIFDPALIQPASTILHVSLRDLSPEIILSSDNVVDDVDHVCRAETSVHLAERLSGNRDFIRCTIGDIIRGAAEARSDGNRPVIFSPFGLGILDLAVSKFIYDLATAQNLGNLIESFLPSANETHSV
ncbi:MAG TPA: 2,3-diaminopropionate biosynthesis protein SbnB [Blastocatellia bacterium]|nr:2,3-diaminopropionate biosynthesis protein SbnB [Blastocatellia bacterium]